MFQHIYKASQRYTTVDSVHTNKPFTMNTSLAPSKSKGKSTLIEDQFASWKWYCTLLFVFTYDNITSIAVITM